MPEQDLTQNPVRELVRRFLITFLLGVVVYRFGIFVPIPGVDATALQALVSQNGERNDPLVAIIRYADMFNGTGIAHASVFGLGIMPYISASIILQLLTFSIPALKALQKEGEGGRRKLNQYTRYTTVVLCLVQSAMAAIILTRPDQNGHDLVNVTSKTWFVVQSMVVITTGSMVLLWLAEQITKFGIGNGVSVIIMMGILSSIPAAFVGGDQDFASFLMIGLVSLVIIACIVVVVQATRRINLEQQRRVQGNRLYGTQTTSLPLKLNHANVVPVIFASPVMVLVSTAFGYLGLNLFDYGLPGYRYLFAGLIIAFTFFYISITFDLNELSNHFKQAGFFVRGIKPGKKTVDFLSYHLTRITFVGAIFLAIIAILPEILDQQLHIASNRGGRALMGGTGLLIVVGVALDIMQKVASFFLAHQFGQQMGGDGVAAAKQTGKRF